MAIDFWHRHLQQRLRSLLLLSMCVAILIHQYLKKPVSCLDEAKLTGFTGVVPACVSNGSVVNLKFLGSRSFCVHLASNDIVSDNIFKHGSWAPQNTKFISLLLANSSSKPAVFLDIGANIGWFTIVMSVLGHNVIAIEPMLSNIKLLKASLQASQSSENVILYPHALGITSDECLLISGDSNIGDGHVLCGAEAKKGMNASVAPGYSVRQSIPITRLDALVRQNIDVLKIDVEGYELFAVQSGNYLFKNYQVRHVLSEFSPSLIRGKGADPYEYLAFFISCGYEIRVAEQYIGDQYQSNSWRVLRTYKTEEDLRELVNKTELVDLWFMKN